MNPENIKVGVGVLIPNKIGQIILVHRCGIHAPGWSIPGGTFEVSEDLEQTASREIGEELGIKIHRPQLIGFVLDRATYEKEGVLPLSFIFEAKGYSGTPEIQPKEREKGRLDDWAWQDIEEELPKPHVPFSEKAITNKLKGAIYEGISDGEPYTVYGGVDVTEILHF